MRTLKQNLDEADIEEKELTIATMRRLLEDHGMISPLVRNAINQRYHLELTENEFLTALAFSAVMELEELQSVYYNMMSGSVRPLTIGIIDKHNT